MTPAPAGPIHQPHQPHAGPLSIQAHTNRALCFLKGYERENGGRYFLSITERPSVGPQLQVTAYTTRVGFLDAVATDQARWPTNLWALRCGVSEGEAIHQAVQAFVSAFSALPDIKRALFDRSEDLSQ